MKIFTKPFFISLPVVILALGIALSSNSIVNGQEAASPPSTLEVTADFSLAPNPSYGQITLKSQHFNDVPLEINIYSITGNLVKNVKIQQYQRDEEIMIDLNGLMPSLYLLELKSGIHSSIKKFVLR
ncbi:MAG: T9SS type A sorting domain-containing protein [Cyclobacteriaceae bacterium]